MQSVSLLYSNLLIFFKVISCWFKISSRKFQNTKSQKLVTFLIWPNYLHYNKICVYRGVEGETDVFAWQCRSSEGVPQEWFSNTDFNGCFDLSWMAVRQSLLQSSLTTPSNCRINTNHNTIIRHMTRWSFRCAQYTVPITAIILVWSSQCWRWK